VPDPIGIPSYLSVPPSTAIAPPTETKRQLLPFEELSWQDFERLCYRLACLEADVEACRVYGLPGNKQAGLDIYARVTGGGKYRVYQCKREKDFGPQKITDAVDKFLEGDWCARSSLFVLCMMESIRTDQRIEAFEKAVEKAKGSDVLVEAWDGESLSLRLKEKPALVDDFFGRAWVREFCGAEVAASLGDRLSADEVREFRSQCRRFYENLFSQIDPGIPIEAIDGAAALLRDRYVPPVLREHNARIAIGSSSEPAKDDSGQQVSEPTSPTPTDVVKDVQSRAFREPVDLELDTFLASGDQFLVLGGPGSGKSTLLRFLALDLLSDTPSLPLTARRWASYLPVYLPFAFWAHRIAQDGQCSLVDAVHAWLRGWSEEERLGSLFRQAIQDDRLLLLVDGLDESLDDDARNIAFGRLRVFIVQRATPAVVSARPHALERLQLGGLAWARAEIRPLTPAQQRRLIELWFLLRHRQPEGKEDLGHELERAGAEAARFVGELERSPHLQQLSAVPLLLSVLIHQRLSGRVLPSDRFEAYAALSDHLIERHPALRRSGAGVLGAADGMRPNDLKIILEALAYCIQCDHPAGLISIKDADAFVSRFLQDPSGAFGLSPPDARAATDEVLRIGEQALGLLVRRTPEHIGFLHRSLQDFLSARYLAGTDSANQTSIFEKHVGDRQWSEVLLGTVRLASSSAERQRLVALVLAKVTAGTVASRLMGLELIAEIAFGNFQLAASSARECAAAVFEAIENPDGWMRHRERLLEHALYGLNAMSMRAAVSARLHGWFPDRTAYKSTLLSVMAEWKPDQKLVDSLARAVHDEDSTNQRSAARALAKLASSHPPAWQALSRYLLHGPHLQVVA